MGKDTTNLREVIGRALESAGWLNCDPDDWAELCNSLAAKDREIAELRRQLETWRAAEHAAINKGEAIKRERDEAWECVGRLYSALRLAMSRSIHHSECDRLKSSFDEYDHSPQKECSCHISTMGAALAATPEHLRD